MIFRPPYQFTFDPPAAQEGSPTVINRGRAGVGERAFFLQSNSSHPSSASILSSFGMMVGPPVDSRGRAIRGRSELAVTPFLDFGTFFYSGGTFASALTSSSVSIFVEEFDSVGRFTRGINGPELVIFREDPWWFSGSD